MESSSLSHRSTQSGSDESPVDLRVVCVIIGGFAFFAPIMVYVGPRFGLMTIFGMTWRFDRSWVSSSWMVMDPIHVIAPLPFTVWRLVFVYQMVRYYRERGTLLGTVLLGVFAETSLLLAEYIMRVFSPPTMSLWDPGLTFPTPLMLVVASAFLWLNPLPVPKTPFGDQAMPDRWRDRNTDSEGRAPIESLRENGSADMKGGIKCPMCGNEEIRRGMLPGILGVRAQLVYLCKKCGQR
ncbi:MAG: hypothetical protein ACE5H4_07435 [Candidatus Thorarchaeota archaeon]